MKDTFYFSHDYNTRSDDKIKMLIRKHGVIGYGIFWCIIEDLYNNANALRTDYDGIAYDLRVDKETIKSIINDFDLFVFDDDIFGSLSVERRLNERSLKSAKARESALSRWNKNQEDANAMRTQCDSNAIKERKGKESIIKENILDEKKSEKSESLINLEKWMKENTPLVLKLKTQLTSENLDKLLALYTKQEIVTILESMNNYKKLTTSYTSVYLTLKKWLIKEYGTRQ